MAPGLPDLAARRREPELMDQPGLDPALHREALDALERVNFVSLATARAWREVERLGRGRREPVRVLDVACGGGDVLVGLARRARRAGIAVDLLGLDRSTVALARARRRAVESMAAPGGASTLPRFETADVLEDDLPTDSDLVLCSLFLHHLSEPEAVALLRSLAAACRGVLLVQDLRRTTAGYALAWLGLHLLTRSSVAREDGLASIRGAFTLDEARELAREAGLASAEVRACWPQRFVLRWSRSGT